MVGTAQVQVHPSVHSKSYNGNVPEADTMLSQKVVAQLDVGLQFSPDEDLCAVWASVVRLLEFVPSHSTALAAGQISF